MKSFRFFSKKRKNIKTASFTNFEKIKVGPDGEENHKRQSSVNLRIYDIMTNIFLLFRAIFVYNKALHQKNERVH